MKKILLFLAIIVVIFGVQFFNGWIIWKELYWFGPVLNIDQFSYSACVGISVLLVLASNMLGISNLARKATSADFWAELGSSLGTKLVLLFIAWIIYLLIS